MKKRENIVCLSSKGKREREWKTDRKRKRGRIQVNSKSVAVCLFVQLNCWGLQGTMVGEIVC